MGGHEADEWKSTCVWGRVAFTQAIRKCAHILRNPFILKAVRVKLIGRVIPQAAAHFKEYGEQRILKERASRRSSRVLGIQKLVL